jgi:hypothetical protein
VTFVTHRLLVSITFASALLVSAPSRAETCGNVTERGMCQDAKTLVFCKDGTLQSLRCGAGELCSHDDRFHGAAGCIATRYTGCGAVPELGLCAGNTLLYCANNQVEELACPEGTLCAAQAPQNGEDGVEYDCVIQSIAPTTPTEPEPVEPGQDGTDVDEGSPMETQQATPGPSVEQGGAPAEEFDASGGAGCSGGAHGLWALLSLGLLRLRRRA